MDLISLAPTALRPALMHSLSAAARAGSTNGTSPIAERRLCATVVAAKISCLGFSFKMLV